MQVSDTALMRRLSSGDQQALAILMERHAGQVLNVLYRIVLSRDEAEDLCQEVFEKLWYQAGTWEDKAQVSTWLYRVASNLAINHRQRFQNRHVIDSDEAVRLSDEQGNDSHNSSSDSIDGADHQHRISIALASLPEAQRMAMVFRYYQGLAVKEVAHIMDSSPKAIESLLSRAKPQLKSLLGDLYHEL